MKSFEKEQQDLIDSFKRKITSVCEEVISEFYTDVVTYAETDAHINFTNKLRDELYHDLINEISTKNGQYSWAHTIRMALLKQHKDELQNKIIEDLQEKVKSAEERYFQIVQRSRY